MAEGEGSTKRIRHGAATCGFNARLSATHCIQSDFLSGQICLSVK
jgi:hypothetical protein